MVVLKEGKRDVILSLQLFYQVVENRLAVDKILLEYQHLWQ